MTTVSPFIRSREGSPFSGCPELRFCKLDEFYFTLFYTTLYSSAKLRPDDVRITSYVLNTGDCKKYAVYGL